MEQIQIFDAVNSKSVNVFVAEEIAERCRLDANFAAELVKQIDEQNVEEGSTIEIETVVDMGSSDTLVEKESWSRTETLKFLKLYQKYEEKYSSNKTALWLIISKELARRNIFKSPEKCQCKWKNLIRTYKGAKERSSFSRFHYFRAVDDLVYGRQLVLSDTDSEMESCDEMILKNMEDGIFNSKEAEKEWWSRYETIKFLKIFQENKFRLDSKNCSQEQLMKFISSELAKDGINKTPGKCMIKWKNLQRSYKRILEKDKNMTSQRFKYFKEVDDLFNDRIISSENLSDTQDDSDCLEGSEESLVNPKPKIEIKEEPMDMDTIDLELLGSPEEISTCLEIYNNQKFRLQDFSDEGKFWKLISEELKHVGIYKTPSECGKICNHFEKDKSRKKLVNRIENGNSRPLMSDSQEDSDNFDKSQGQYERIIIETEEDGNTDAENAWSIDEIVTLISSCAKHITTKKSKEIEESVWKKISSNVSRSGKDKSVDDCKTKWEELYSTYEDCKKLDLECENFAIFENVEQVLKRSNETQSENTSCKCREKRLQEKQRRHLERMQILKRKLDIEERKVKAFEDYVKYIKR